MAKNIKILREGRCVRCAQCGVGQYQKEWTSTDTCASCEPDELCAAAEYKQHPSIKATYVDGEWKGACEQTPNEARSKYACAKCPRWRHENDVYELLLGCGTEPTYKRWHPFNVEENRLQELECHYGNAGGDDPLCLLPMQAHQPNTSDVVEYTHAIPYCKPGWYVEAGAEDCDLLVEAEDARERAWNAACCKKCGNEAQAQLTRAPEFKKCTGDTEHDTERYVERCENNYYRRSREEGDECALCTTCGL